MSAPILVSRPDTIQDVFFRVGGAETTATSATVSLLDNASNSIIDDVWAWRADHGNNVGWTANKGDTRVVVTGSNVTAYGLAVEHYQKSEVVWTGQGGTDVFFQNELPYDVPGQSVWNESAAFSGYPAFQVGAGVKTFHGYGMGSYVVFINTSATLHVTAAFQAPKTPGVRFSDVFGVWIGGSGGLDSIVNGTGGPDTSTNPGTVTPVDVASHSGCPPAEHVQAGLVPEGRGIRISPAEGDAVAVRRGDSGPVAGPPPVHLSLERLDGKGRAMAVNTKSATRTSTRRPARAKTAEHLTRADRVAKGKDARTFAPLESHAEFTPDRRRDPVGLLIEQAKSRVPELVPVRHGRMLVSPFTYYRGAALPMAADLATTPTSGLRVQLCGDAHLSNFGAFASPSRRLVFDVNDFDETLPGPFEWDIKRLAASLAVAGRDNGFSGKDRRQIELAAAEGYRTAMRAFAGQNFMDVWYAHLEVEDAINEFRSQLKAKRVKLTEKMAAKARTIDSMKALNKLTTEVDGQRRIVSEPPLIQPVEEVFPDMQSGEIYDQIRDVLGKYRRSLQSDRRHLLEYFTLVQLARKVVGVGSVGTRAWVLLMQGADATEPLFLQAKEAEASVLAAYCGRSQYSNQGERVVAGQHLMQAESDIFLGWTRVTGPDGVDRDYYVRQLKDWKLSMPVEQMIPSGMTVYARMCGWTLARAHARSGDRVALAAYLGGSAKFDNAIADFAETYADQNERDHAALQAAVKDGKTTATTGI